MESKSPGFVTPKKPVLTGSARKIKDNAADWHNLMLKWENLNESGFGVGSKIVNLRIRNLSYEKMLVEDTVPGNENVEGKEELERMCSELVDILESMQQIQMKMEKLTLTFKGVCDLEAFQCRGEASCPILFHTWPTSLFCEQFVYYKIFSNSLMKPRRKCQKCTRRKWHLSAQLSVR